MKLSKEKNKWYDRKNIITVIFLSISLSFTVFFFSPIDIFLGNQKDFYIGANIIFVSMLLLSLLSSLVIIFIGLLSLKNKTVYNIVTSLLFGLLLVFYIQSLFFNGKMTVMNGTVTSYSDMNFYNIFNAVIMYFIFMTPLIMTISREKYNGNNAVMNFAKGKAVSYLSALIFAMQLFGNIGMLASNGIVAADNSVYCFSLEPITSLSKEKNITVFLIDMLDGEWMDDVLEQYPEMNDKLEGFTYYKNNISRYSATFPSVPCMITDTEYDPQYSRYEFLRKVWQGETIFSRLNENDYKVNMLLDRSTTFNSFFYLTDYNLVKAEKDNYKVNYFGKCGIIDTMVNLSLTKLSPYIFKNLFSYNVNEVPSDLFLIFGDNVNDNMVSSVSLSTDLKVDNYIHKYGINADCGQKTFSFIHLCGAHSVSERLSSLNPSFNKDTETGTTSTSIRGTFETLFTYFDMMKDLGVYDNSTIIIIADHGRAMKPVAATLLIKPENAEHSALKYDIGSELSNVNFFASILEYAGIDHSEYGYSYNDIINGYNQDRYHTYASGNIVYNDMVFKVTGDARDSSNWEEVN